MCFVGGSDFVQNTIGSFHHFRQTKRTANFNHFTSGKDDFFTGTQCIEHQQNGSRIVVDGKPVLRSGQQLQNFTQMIVALTAFSRFQIKFKIAVPANFHQLCNQFRINRRTT